MYKYINFRGDDLNGRMVEKLLGHIGSWNSMAPHHSTE